jgi:hypothetical protein
MKISGLPLEEVHNQLQILEYIATNTRDGLTDGDRILLRKLEAQKQRLTEREHNARNGKE